MIRFIAAIDSQRGLAKNNQIPWNLPSDKARFRQLTLAYGANVFMGRSTYDQMNDYLKQRTVYVASRSDIKLTKGGILVNDVDSFISNFKTDLWVIGGAGLFENTIKYADELYLTIVEGDFNCDHFFPDYKDFNLTKNDGRYTENGLNFTYQLFTRF